ncbi:MAG: DUF1501 domain-containing protein [Pirellulaceae bacterium]|nr:DUF1501 domain-containing protein [Pirellulaceae bacterium]
MTHSLTRCGRVELADSRRDFLARAAMGTGAIGLASLLRTDLEAAPANSFGSSLAVQPQHFPAHAKSLIMLFMVGGPSQIETFDPKPELVKHHLQSLPSSFNTAGLSLQFMRPTDGKLMASAFPFKKYGDSGLEVSSLFPQLAKHADDLAVIRSCYHDSFIHGPAITQMTTGSTLLGHPSVGAWLTYGLGSESDSLPAYIALSDGGFRGGKVMYHSGYLPAVYQGTVLRDQGHPIQNLNRPKSISPEQQRRMIDRINAWNQVHRSSREGDSRLDARIANYELAYRMQTAAPELIDLSRETRATQELYGIGTDSADRFGKMCLLSRRMVERGVRCVLLCNTDWDGHGECGKNHAGNAKRIDQPIAGLLADLKQRGMLDSTLVVWTGEFGRTPVMQGNQGRDHSPYGFSSWMAGGGIRGGQVIGATDDFAFRAVEDKLHVHDLHATILSLMGLNHERLTYLFEGRERRLTDIGGDRDIAKRLRS